MANQLTNILRAAEFLAARGAKLKAPIEVLREDITKFYSPRNASLQTRAERQSVQTNAGVIFREQKRVKNIVPPTKKEYKEAKQNNRPVFSIKNADNRTASYKHNAEQSVNYASYTIELPETTQLLTALDALQYIADTYKSGFRFAQCFMICSKYKNKDNTWAYINKTATRELASGSVGSQSKRYFSQFLGEGDVSIIRVGIRFTSNPKTK